ncbi:hypothetical protein CK203_053677 [Vitis vinifera]|uniref:Uncharacterized protein n=1 Tax=Vitis vinifera TaxID=29760 RepID=A0A438GS32_VITVI|nr:hypothetical protein CK203_053677 [Vitis vinifera]
MGGGGDFMVTVSRKEVVAAALPKPHGSGNGGDELRFGSMVRVVKEALAQALVSYYAFAGEVVSNSVGEPELLCNNRGVDFTEAYADVQLQDLNLYNPDDSIEGSLSLRRRMESCQYR